MPPELIELGRACRAERWKELWRIRLPYAIPFIFSGLKAAISLAVVGAVVAEFVNADRGLGFLIATSTAFFKVPMAWGALIILSVMGIVLFQIVVIVERVFFPWSPGIDKPVVCNQVERARSCAKRQTVIRGGRVLDIKAHRAPPADILIEGDTIVEIGPPGMAAPADAKVDRRQRRLMHPGLVNGHTHSHGNLGKGMGDRWTLELLLTAAPWISGNRTLEDKYLSHLIGAVEMLLKGCTACYDLTAEFPLPTVEGLDACAQAYADAGMRAVLAPMVADISFYRGDPGPDGASAGRPAEGRRALPAGALQGKPRRDEAGAAMAGSFDRELVGPAVAPTIPHHCSDEFMRGLR